MSLHHENTNGTNEYITRQRSLHMSGSNQDEGRVLSRNEFVRQVLGSQVATFVQNFSVEAINNSQTNAHVQE